MKKIKKLHKIKAYQSSHSEFDLYYSFEANAQASIEALMTEMESHVIPSIATLASIIEKQNKQIAQLQKLLDIKNK